MDALPNSLNVTPGRGPVPALDLYGRDKESPSERLRSLSDLDADTGYSPLYHSVLADLPRLTSGNVCTLLVLVLNMLSLGRPDNPKRGKRHAFTLPVDVEVLAAYCRAHIRDVQRCLKDMKERGMIAVKTTGRGQVSVSLLLADWRALPDYATAKKVVPIDEAEDDAAADDEAPAAVSKDAVRLVAKPLSVKAGRASRAVAIKVGVTKIRFENTAPVDITYDGVVQSGELVVSTRFSGAWQKTAEGEGKENAQRHVCRDEPANGGSPLPPLAGRLVELFEPLLQRCGAKLLAGDRSALLAACAECVSSSGRGDLPFDFLTHFVMAGKNPRAARAISGPKAVVAIVREARINWEQTGGLLPAIAPAGAQASAKPAGRAAAKKTNFVDNVRRVAAARLARTGTFDRLKP